MSLNMKKHPSSSFLSKEPNQKDDAAPCADGGIVVAHRGLSRLECYQTSYVPHELGIREGLEWDHDLLSY